MNKKIIVTVGVSGSGKSTWVKEQWEENPDKTLIVNRDKIRELLFGYTESTVKEYYTRPDINKLEKQVTKYEDVLINEALCENKTVIIDATHLKDSYIERYKFWNVSYSVKYFHISLEEALLRDSKRVRSVGEEVIRKQYANFKSMKNSSLAGVGYKAPVELFNDESKNPCILLDIDGTVAHMYNRSPYDWKLVGEDAVDGIVKAVSNACAERVKVIICTGRDAVCLPETINWLNENGIKYEKIFARKENDTRPDWVVKEEMWREIAKDYYIAALIDDRQQVVRRARALGLKVFNVEYNNF